MKPIVVFWNGKPHHFPGAQRRTLEAALEACLIERGDNSVTLDAHHPAYARVLEHLRAGQWHAAPLAPAQSPTPRTIATPDKPRRSAHLMASAPFQATPRAASPDTRDDQQARWGRTRHEGYATGRYLQPPPLLFTADHHPLWLGDLYRGRSAFLICGGPSFAELDHERLRQPGLLTLGLNNAAKTFRPHLWMSVDDPSHFLRSIWLDPTILKFAPICHANKRIFDSDAWQWTNHQVRDCPAVVYYKRNEHFQARQFLWEDTFNWGNHKSHGGGRSVMLPAVRLLFTLGVRRVFLLGADFRMDHQNHYHFDQHRAAGSVRGNSSTYQKLDRWFKELRPLFEAEGFHLYNCNPHSGLTAFDPMPFEKAIDLALAEWGPIDLAHERTAGLYDQDKPKP